MHVCSISDYLWTCMAVRTWTSDRCCVRLWVNVLWQGQVYRYVWSLRKLTVGQEAIVRSGHGTTDWFKIGKVVIKTIYCHPANLTFMQIGDGSLVAKSCLTLTNPWTVAHQAPLSMGFSWQEYWSGLPFPSPIFPSHGSNPGLLHCGQIFYCLIHQRSITSCKMLGWMNQVWNQVCWEKYQQSPICR